MNEPPRTVGAVYYLRVSSDNRQHPAESFEYQRERIENCMTRQDSDLPVITEYRDVLTGKHSRRPAFQQMLSDARAGLFSHLGVYSIDRIGRNTQDTLSIIDELTDLGVEIVVAELPNLDMDSPSGNLFLRMRVAIAQFEIEQMSQRVRDTKRSSLRSGNWPCPLPDGYRRRERNS